MFRLAGPYFLPVYLVHGQECTDIQEVGGQQAQSMNLCRNVESHIIYLNAMHYIFLHVNTFLYIPCTYPYTVNVAMCMCGDIAS